MGEGTKVAKYHKISSLRKKLTWKTKCEKYHAKLSGCSPNGTVNTNLILTSDFFILNLLQASSFSEVTAPIWLHLDWIFLKFSVEKLQVSWEQKYLLLVLSLSINSSVLFIILLFYAKYKAKSKDLPDALMVLHISWTRWYPAEIELLLK